MILIILAMDKNNLHDILAYAQINIKINANFLNFAKELGIQEVPDPYYGGDDGFEDVLRMIKVASQIYFKKFRFISRWILI